MDVDVEAVTARASGPGEDDRFRRGDELAATVLVLGDRARCSLGSVGMGLKGSAGILNVLWTVGVEVALVRAFLRGSVIDASEGRLKLSLSDGVGAGFDVAGMTVLAGPRGVLIVL